MIAVPFIIISIITIYYAYRTRRENEKILYTIDKMIALSIEGEAIDAFVDESMLSKIEMKFKDFLSSAQLLNNSHKR